MTRSLTLASLAALALTFGLPSWAAPCGRQALAPTLSVRLEHHVTSAADARADAGRRVQHRETRALGLLAWRAGSSLCARGASAQVPPARIEPRAPVVERAPVSLSEVLAWTSEAAEAPLDVRRARRRAWMPARVELDVQFDSEHSRLDELRVEQDFDDGLALDSTDLRDQERWGDTRGHRVRGTIAWDLRDAIYSASEATIEASSWRRQRAQLEALEAASEAWVRWSAAWLLWRSGESGAVAARDEMLAQGAALDVLTSGAFGAALDARGVRF